MRLLNISDGIYGSTFFNDYGFSWVSMLLLVLFLFLFVFFTLIIFSVYNEIIMLVLKQQLGNWHFVDVVWLFVIYYSILLGRYLKNKNYP
jgi:heme/copper-type cytochrome/quinol oxidase subunit 3